MSCLDKYEKGVRTRLEKYWKPFPDWFVDELVEETDRYRAKYGYLTADEKVKFKCVKHNVEYVQRVADHIYRLSNTPKKTGCHQCSIEKKAATKIKNGYINVRPDWFIDDLMYESDKKLAREGTLTSFQKLTFKCDKGHKYEQWGYDHIRCGERKCSCPICNCGTHRGKVEKELCEYFSSLYEVIPNSRKLVQSPTGRPMEIDIYFPEKSLAVEVDGPYWHKEVYDTYEDYLDDLSNVSNGYRVNKWKGYHEWKRQKCADLGIRLVNINPDEGFDKCKQIIEEELNGY